MTVSMISTERRASLRESRPDVCVLAGSASPALAGVVAARCGVSIVPTTAARFPDGECAFAIGDDVSGHDVVIVQAIRPPVNDHLVELLAMVDAARRAGAGRVIAVLPYLGYARSDRRTGRGPVMASLVARALEMVGVDRVITLDVHTPAIEGFFTVPITDVSAMAAMVHAARGRIAPGAVVVAPDFGAVRRATVVAELLGADVAVCHKQRTSATTVAVARVSGDVAGRACVIVDDMIATGATIAECARAVRAAGAQPYPVVLATHAVFSPGSNRALREADPALVVLTDSIPDAIARAPDVTIEVVPIGSTLADAVIAAIEGAPRSEQRRQEVPCRLDYAIEPRPGGRWPAD